MKFPTGLLIGFALGASTVLIAQRLRQACDEEDADSLRDRIADQLADLEDRAGTPVRAQA